MFVALLRTTEQDGKKPLVRQALDVLAPALSKRLAPPGPTERFPIWIRYTKKVHPARADIANGPAYWVSWLAFGFM